MKKLIPLILVLFLTSFAYASTCPNPEPIGCPGETINVDGSTLSGNITLDGTITQGNNIKFGNPTWSSLTGTKNILLLNAGSNMTTGSQNFCGGQLTCESTTTGSNNNYIGYSTGYNGSGVNGIGAHACSGIYTVASGGDYDLNACYGHEAGNPRHYFNPVYFGGAMNLLAGARTGYIGEIEVGVDPSIVKSSAIGPGAGWGNSEFLYHTSDLSRTAVTDTVTVNSTAHGLADKTLISFRDVTPDNFLDVGATATCALTWNSNTFRARSLDANSVELEWSRSIDGAKDLRHVSTLPTAAISGCLAAGDNDRIQFDSDVSAIANNTEIVFPAGTCNPGGGNELVADTVYYSCKYSKTDGTTPLIATDLTFKTAPTCTSGNMSNYINFTAASNHATTGYYYDSGAAELGYDALVMWTKPDFDTTFADGVSTVGFDSECDDVTGTPISKLDTTAVNLSYSTAVGTDTVCDESNTVCIGRKKDAVKIRGEFKLSPFTETVTTEANITDPLTSSVMLVNGDNDVDNDAIDLQNGETAGQFIYIIAGTGIDADDTITINMADTTCTNCPAIVFDKQGENATLIWTGATWTVVGLQTAL